MADRGFATVGYDEDHAKVEALREESKDRAVRGAADMKEFIALLSQAARGHDARARRRSG
jgi:hypothetical protein